MITDNETIRVRISVDKRSLASVFFKVRIPMRAKNDFKLCFGPTDDNGEFILETDDVVQEAMREKCLFIMDYLDPIADATGPWRIRPMGREETRRAISAYDQFNDVTDYPEDHRHNLEESLRQLDSLGPATLACTCEAGKVQVVCESAEN